jgi:Ca-activated chloride channel family protein
MTFAWPLVLWLLLAPAALLARELGRRYRGAPGDHPNILRAEAGLHSLNLKPQGKDGGPSRKSRIWLGLGVALAIAALARPQWGIVDQPRLSQSREILIAIDLSRSMLTGDVKPSRLERAKLLAQSLLTNLSGERVGLVAFAGTAFLQSPLSSDYGILDEFLPALSPDFMPVGGTNYGALMDTAAAAFGDDSNGERYLIVLSDGGATDDDWRNHIDALKRKGVHVIGLGVGTTSGGFIPDRSGGFMKDGRGAVVLSKLEGDNLRELAQKTGGVYRDAGEWLDLAEVLRASVEAGRKGTFIERRTMARVDRYQWFLAPALLYLLVSFLLEFPVRPTPRDVKLSTRDGGPGPARAAALLIVALACLSPFLAQAARAEEQAPDSGRVSRIVGRLSSQDQSTALDWSELARETIAWGEHVKSGGQSVPTGPVRDALAGVDSGSAMDVRAADWPQMRTQLEDLLQPPKQKKQDQQQNQQQQNQQQQNQQNQQNQDSKQDQQQQQQDKKESPQPQSGTQKVGGAADRGDETLARNHPELAPLLDKLQQLRSQDAPAELWQKIQDSQPRPPSSDQPEKDW